MTIWLVWLRVEPLPGCKVVPEAFDPRLECALPAAGEADVPAALDAALARHRQRVAEIEACVAYREQDWSDANDPERRVRDAAEVARASGAARFASFGLMPPGPAA
jgi:hypothetical protein